MLVDGATLATMPGWTLTVRPELGLWDTVGPKLGTLLGCTGVALVGTALGSALVLGETVGS